MSILFPTTKKQLANRKLLIILMQHVSAMEKQFHKKLFDLGTFQWSENDNDRIRHSKKAVINCGTTCCISGWVALCPAFRKQGVIQGSCYGDALMLDKNDVKNDADETFMALFGIDRSTSHALIYGGDYAANRMKGVQPSDVIREVRRWE